MSSASSAVETPYFRVADLSALVSEIAPDSIVSRTFYSDSSVKAIIFGFAAGQELSEHTSARPAIMHFLHGEARITLGDDVSHASPGTWVAMQPNLPHSVFAETPVVMMLTMLQK